MLSCCAPPWELKLRYVAPLDLEALLHYNGLEVLGRYGDGEGGPCTEETEGRTVVCVSKERVER